MTTTEDSPAGVLVVGAAPDQFRQWARSVWDHRGVLWILARKDFQTRYKRTSLGLLWAFVVPLLQASVMALVFSKVVKTQSTPHFVAFVMSGVLAYTYFSTTIGFSSTAIVDSAYLTDKVWFPRALLVLVPCLTNTVGLVVTLVFLLCILPVIGGHFGPALLLLPVGVAFLLLFTAGLSALLASIHVYFRDVRYLVQASLTVLVYITPIVYPPKVLGRYRWLLDINPLTGIVGVFRRGILPSAGPSMAALTVSLAVTAALLVIGTEVMRRYDRLFVDLL